MTDDKLAAANQITSAQVVGIAKDLAEMMNLKRQKEALFKPLALQLAHTIGALQALQLTLVDMPRMTAELHKTECDAMAVLRAADRLIEAEQACLRG